MLKILAIILIIISHVTQTLSTENTYIMYQNYILDLSVATTDIQYIVLIIFRHLGVWGNTIFFICSAWFLLKSSKYNKKKWLFMLVEVWVVSTIILLITYILRKGSIDYKIIIKSFLPTSFSNNWYVTCYLLFYPIHPILNDVIKHMDKQSLFRITAAMFIINFGFDFICSGWFFPSTIILWITIYFTIAYLQLYLKGFTESIKYNLIILVMGFIGFIGIILITDLLGLHTVFFGDKMLYWAVNRNPFLFVISITMFNLSRNIQFKNHFINYISKLSLLIYIIHENIILRTYYRPYMINYVYENYGYDNIVVWVLLLAIIIFFLTIIIAAIYERTIQKLVAKISDVLYTYGRKIYLIMEQYAMMFK